MLCRKFELIPIKIGFLFILLFIFRFDQYNVIITPPSAISHSFPWDIVSLLIEYGPNILNISPPPSTFTHIVLHCVLDSSTSSG